MSAAMDNLLKMFKAAREATGESSGTVPSAVEMEALPIRSTVLMAEDDDPRNVGWGHLEENPESILTVEEVAGWREKFELPIGMEVHAPYSGERADNPCKGWSAIYEIIFLLGLTFPMPWLASTVLVYYQNTLGQLMPNSWRAILGDQGLQIKRIYWWLLTRVNKILAAFEPPFSPSQLACITRSSANMSRKGKSKAEPPSVDEMSECMSRRRPTPPKGKGPASSSESIALDNEPSATPLPVAGSPHQLPGHWIDLIIINLQVKITNNINDLIQS
ncbi:hypothetical protein TIFTF001_000112 [Ficus carica]|uniref:Uncharacterized protein n=1 Tax=Ficus carica TaxID=3494 RepID=A0AA87Z8B3_FICCA|nr:hypothetical protein TIFTF001_000112 [Ficus carica]